MPAEMIQLIDDLAKTIARELLADLKAHKIPKVGIDEVRAAIAARTTGKALDEWQTERLETLTLRRFIEATFR